MSYLWLQAFRHTYGFPAGLPPRLSESQLLCPANSERIIRVRANTIDPEVRTHSV